MDVPKKIILNKKLVKFCREQGISKLKTSEFEFELASFALTPKFPKIKDSFSEEPAPREYTDEEMLLWSSAGLPEEGAH